jgi:hypothetical protein
MTSPERCQPEASGADGGSPQTAPLPSDIFDAITDALADALVADYLADQRAMVDSPRGTDHPEAA